jgi:hypothetical protein
MKMLTLNLHVIIKIGVKYNFSLAIIVFFYFSVYIFCLDQNRVNSKVVAYNI